MTFSESALARQTDIIVSAITKGSNERVPWPRGGRTRWATWRSEARDRIAEVACLGIEEVKDEMCGKEEELT